MIPPATILVIDDSESKRYTIVRYLSRAGYNILEAKTAEEGLATLNKAPEGIAMAIVDVKLPDAIGYDICDSIRSDPKTAHLPLMHISATYTTTEHKVRGLDRGADAYLAGPIDPEELVANVKALIRMRDAEVRAHKQSKQLEALAEREREARKLAEQAKEELQRELTLRKTISDNSTQALLMLDEGDRCTFMNPAAERMFGYTLHELRGRPLHEMVHHHRPDGTPYPMDECPINRAVSERGGLREHEDVFIRKNGEFFPVLVSTSPIVEDDGPTCTIVEISDLTERKKAQESMRESEERFRTLADNMAQLAWMAEADGTVFWLNKRWFEYTGTTPEEMEYRGWIGLHHPEHVERVLAKFYGCVQSGEVWEDTFPLRGKEGEYRWFLSRAIPIRDAGGKLVRWFGTNTDITELREMQSELERAQAALKLHTANLEHAVDERTAKLREAVQELEAFSYSIAHDMRAPLRAMHGFSEIVLEEYAQHVPDAGKNYLHRISASAARLDELIRDVLNYSRIVREELKLERVDVEKLLHGILDTYPSLTAGGGTVEVEGPLPSVVGNVAALTQVFSNLLGNAVKFVKPGEPPRVRVWAQIKRGDDTVRLWIQDNGIGIPKELQGRLFGIFQRLHGQEPYEGTGIGLAIVRKAVERMGGRVGLQSEPGKGSRFWVEFKMADAEGIERLEKSEQLKR
jgi:PAS domain S-box-containing protein